MYFSLKFHGCVEEKWEIYFSVLLLSFSFPNLVCLILVLFCSCVAPILFLSGWQWYNHSIHLIHPSRRQPHASHNQIQLSNSMFAWKWYNHTLSPIRYLTHAHPCCNYLWGLKSDQLSNFLRRARLGGMFVSVKMMQRHSGRPYDPRIHLPWWQYMRALAVITYIWGLATLLLVTFLFSLVSDVSANYEGNAVYFGGLAI